MNQQGLAQQQSAQAPEQVGPQGQGDLEDVLVQIIELLQQGVTAEELINQGVPAEIVQQAVDMMQQIESNESQMMEDSESPMMEQSEEALGLG